MTATVGSVPILLVTTTFEVTDQTGATCGVFISVVAASWRTLAHGSDGVAWGWAQHLSTKAPRGHRWPRQDQSTSVNASTTTGSSETCDDDACPLLSNGSTARVNAPASVVVNTSGRPAIRTSVYSIRGCGDRSVSQSIRLYGLKPRVLYSSV
ncbi:MAG: hypothetical protein J07HX5_01268 [halophilic archaeon J07HX5]|nr:MAG: hypothetical protein J07HX5_01268 [halophilic archaeon J07HX5]